MWLYVCYGTIAAAHLCRANFRSQQHSSHPAMIGKCNRMMLLPGKGWIGIICIVALHRNAVGSQSALGEANENCELKF